MRKALVVLLLTLTACASQGLMVTDLWARPSPQMATNAAFYMVIENGTDQAEELMSANSSACGVTELHEMYDMGEGVMGMRPVEGIEIPAGETVTLQPGGLHVMCINRLEDFTAGQIIPLTLSFKNAGTLEYDVTVREN
jgi:periplasmic copper chaperone A